MVTGAPGRLGHGTVRGRQLFQRRSVGEVGNGPGPEAGERRMWACVLSCPSFLMGSLLVQFISVLVLWGEVMGYKGSNSVLKFCCPSPISLNKRDAS